VSSMTHVVRGILLGVLLLSCAVPATDGAGKKILFLGDEVMEAYLPKARKILAEKADCTFVAIPQAVNPNWNAFVHQHISHTAWDVILFSYGRELVFRRNGIAIGETTGDVTRSVSALLTLLRGSTPNLIFCTTTPIRGIRPEYDKAAETKYTGLVNQMILKAGIPVADLADYTQTRLDEMVQLNSYLPTAIGAELMGEFVANSVLEQLNITASDDLPRVLIVGDSIVGGYYSSACVLFSGEAVVFRDGTTYNDPNPPWGKIVDHYLKKGGERGWDIIQFNWGLHAVKYVNERNQNCLPEDPGARIQFTVEEYARQIELFVKELKRTNATLVFATTTPIPEGAPHSIQYVNLKPYNDAAKAVMAKHGIIINDLYAFAYPQLACLQILKNVHFTDYGYQELARQTYTTIKPLLKGGRSGRLR